MLGVYVAIAALILTMLGLIVKIVTFSTEIRVWVMEMRQDRRALRRIPTLELRIQWLEKHLDLSAPELEDKDGGHDDAEENHR